MIRLTPSKAWLDDAAAKEVGLEVGAGPVCGHPSVEHNLPETRALIDDLSLRGILDLLATHATGTKLSRACFFRALNRPDPLIGEDSSLTLLRSVQLTTMGHDIIGRAQTVADKAPTFALPILTRLRSHEGVTRALILEPTRELASQVGAALRNYARFTDLTIAVIYGGVGYQKQLDALKAGVDVIVATPGRLLDHMDQGNCNLGQIEHLVLDEADQMLDMGFLPDVTRILQKCPNDRQTMLFSATIPPAIETLIKWAMKNPETIEIGAHRTPAETVKHVIYQVNDTQKTDLLLELLKRLNYDSVIIFCRTKRGADGVAHRLKAANHAVAILHSDRTQAEREQALDGFFKGKCVVLVATDIAARGLDIAKVSHVINYDVPQHPEDYAHRIGRAEHSGDTFTIITAEDAMHVFSIERYISRTIPRKKLEGFPYRYTALFEADEPGAAKPHECKVQMARIDGGYLFDPHGSEPKV